VECYSCNSKVKKDDACYGDQATLYESKPVCETCYYEDEPCATVFYGNDETPNIISNTRNETDGKFKADWVSTDPWRGYYKTKSDDYSLVNTAELLSYHESEEMLSKFDRKIRKMFDDYNIDYARVFARSSNVFYQNYDLYVKKDDALMAQMLVDKTKREVDYNNPSYYRNIVFDDEALGRLKELFPEEGVQTDGDALKVVEKYGDKMIDELERRMKE